MQDGEKGRFRLRETEPWNAPLQAQLQWWPDTGFAAVIAGEAGSGRSRVARWLHHRSRASGPLVTIDGEDGPRSNADRIRSLRRSSKPGTVVLDNAEFVADEAVNLIDQACSDLQRYARTRWTVLVVCSDEFLNDQLAPQLGAFSPADILDRQATVPPLRKRRADLPGLVRVLLEDLAVDQRTQPRRVSASVLDTFVNHRWPGNVAELRTALDSALLAASPDDSIDVVHLPAPFEHSLTKTRLSL